MPDERSSALGGDVDHAALLGATVAAVLTLTLNEGQWTSLDTCVGVLLLAVVLGFAPPTRPAGESSRAIGWFARCGVVGICAALVVVWPVQRLLIEIDDDCRVSAESQEAYDKCVAGDATSLLWVVIVAATAVCALVSAPSYWGPDRRTTR